MTYSQINHAKIVNLDLSMLLTIFIIVLTIGGVIEISILVFAYLNADEVECNWLWCTFIDKREQNYKQFIETYSECYVNGLKVNCSEFKEEFPDYASHGWNSIDGICPGWKENKSIIECIEDVKE